MFDVHKLSFKILSAKKYFKGVVFMNDVRLLTYEFLKKQDEIRDLPIKLVELFQIAHRHGWQVFKYSEADKLLERLKNEGINLYNYRDTHRGFAISYKSQIIILYRDGMTNLETIRVICHEFAHIVLRHISKGIVLGKAENDAQSEAQELEADEFAVEMMAPLPVLNQLNIQSAADIKEMGILRGDLADQQYQKLVMLRNRSYFAKNSEEIELCEHFDDDIKFRSKEVKKEKIKSKLPIIYACAGITIVLIGFVISSFIRGNSNISTGGEPPQPIAPVASSSPAQTEATPTQIPTVESTVLPTVTPTPETTQKLVYLTKSGTKYHTADCPYINQKDTFTMPIEEAKENDYQACKFCRPDEN